MRRCLPATSRIWSAIPFTWRSRTGTGRRTSSSAPRLLAFGGVPYVLWGIFLRTTVGLHATWLVNSATHKWGIQRFKTRDDSTNNWWVALLTFGEGWHNNHHAHPTSARHGLAWYKLDLNWIGIRTLRALGLVWDVKVARTDAG